MFSPKQVVALLLVVAFPALFHALPMMPPHRSRPTDHEASSSQSQLLEGWSGDGEDPSALEVLDLVEPSTHAQSVPPRSRVHRDVIPRSVLSDQRAHAALERHRPPPLRLNLLLAPPPPRSLEAATIAGGRRTSPITQEPAVERRPRSWEDEDVRRDQEQRFHRHSTEPSRPWFGGSSVTGDQQEEEDGASNEPHLETLSSFAAFERHQQRHQAFQQRGGRSRLSRMAPAESDN